MPTPAVHRSAVTWPRAGLEPPSCFERTSAGPRRPPASASARRPPTNRPLPERATRVRRRLAQAGSVVPNYCFRDALACAGQWHWPRACPGRHWVSGQDRAATPGPRTVAAISRPRTEAATASPEPRLQRPARNLAAVCTWAGPMLRMTPSGEWLTGICRVRSRFGAGQRRVTGAKDDGAPPRRGSCAAQHTRFLSRAHNLHLRYYSM